MVWTRAGFETPTIAELYARFREGETDIVTLSVNPQTYKVEWKRVTAVIAHRRHESLIRVGLVQSRHVTATVSHSFLMYDSLSDRIVPVRGDALRKGMAQPLVRFIPLHVERAHYGKVPLNYDVGLFIGVWLAEGSVNDRANSITLSNNDRALLERCRTAIYNYFPRPKAQNYKGGHIQTTKGRASLQFCVHHPGLRLLPRVCHEGR